MFLNFWYFKLIYNYIWFIMQLFVSFTSISICKISVFKITFLNNETEISN